MRDTFYNAITLIAIAAFAALITYAAIATIHNLHPAEECIEDEVWAPVEYGTYNSTEDAAGTNRACINIDEL